MTFETIGARLRSARKEAGMSLRQLGKEVSLSAAYLSDIELDRRTPTGKTLESICLALGLESGRIAEMDYRRIADGLRRLLMAKPGLAYGFLHMINALAEGKISRDRFEAPLREQEIL